jgi:menaquinone-dependent protoporphyrinogen oxidase
MMKRTVLVAYESRHGSTEGIADRIAAKLRSRDIETTVKPVDSIRDADGYDGYVIGSAVYAMHWLGPVKAFIHRNRVLLRRHPVWLFSSGPLSLDPAEQDQAEARDVAELEREVDARGHRVFGGAWHRGTPPVGVLERMMRVIPAAREALPDGDFRDWAAIDDFATAVAGELELALQTE